jgi:hypothetical protein
MMRRWVSLAVVVVAFGAIVGGAAYATGEKHGINKQMNLRFLDVGDKFAFVDTAAGDAGDLFIFENQLRNRADTKTLGRFIGSCTTLVTPGLTSCRGTLELAKGTIELAAAVDFAAGGRIFAAVTGGTKRYENVRGEVKLSEEVSPGVRRMTVELLP